MWTARVSTGHGAKRTRNPSSISSPVRPAPAYQKLVTGNARGALPSSATTAGARQRSASPPRPGGGQLPRTHVIAPEVRTTAETAARPDKSPHNAINDHQHKQKGEQAVEAPTVALPGAPDGRRRPDSRTRVDGGRRRGQATPPDNGSTGTSWTMEGGADQGRGGKGRGRARERAGKAPP